MSATETQAATAAPDDAMTAANVRASMLAIISPLGPDATASLVISAGGEPASILAYPQYSDFRNCQYFNGATFGEALTKFSAWAASYGPIRRDTTTRKLALDIIDLTDQHGSCTVAMLRGRQHPQADIDAYKDAACVRAGEMSGNAPFVVSA